MSQSVHHYRWKANQKRIPARQPTTTIKTYVDNKNPIKIVQVRIRIRIPVAIMRSMALQQLSYRLSFACNKNQQFIHRSFNILLMFIARVYFQH